MAKKKIDNEIFKTLIEDYNIKDTNDIKDMIKEWFWIGENESSKYWLNVLNELKNRMIKLIILYHILHFEFEQNSRHSQIIDCFCSDYLPKYLWYLFLANFHRLFSS